MKLKFAFLIALVAFSTSCKKEKNQNTKNQTGPQLVFKIKLNPTQERLDVFGNPETLPAGHGAQVPDYNEFRIHSIELVPNEYTPFGQGYIVYNAEMLNDGSKAVIFDKLKPLQDGSIAFTVQLDEVIPGTYKYIRVSAAYQNYNINFRANGFDLVGTIASFVAHNSYISSYKIKNQTVSLSAQKMQGYFGFEVPAIPPYYTGEVIQGQTAGTTVPNPINATSPIPVGSCTVTGIFPAPFTLAGDEKKDVVINLSFSINNSFEWSDANGNNIFEPLDGDTVVDMGLRGLIPYVVE
ncbi:MAG: hypothetical protein M9916_00255 [Crocinitomicaceae bacterium]|nr:hypothetical protein [Crocinitomicaceae bacterium]